MATSFVMKTIVPIVLLLSFETYYLKEEKTLSKLYTDSKVSGIPLSYGFVLLVNVVFSSIVLLLLGFKVADARKIFKEKAKKDGDENSEARYSYPKLYAEGFDNHSTAFNCVQRGHQQALETYSSFVLLGLVGGIDFPVIVSFAGLFWCYSRMQWAQGYATGDASRRYDHWSSRGIWSALLLNLCAAFVVSIKFIINIIL